MEIYVVTRRPLGDGDSHAVSAHVSRDDAWAFADAARTRDPTFLYSIEGVTLRGTTTVGIVSPVGAPVA